MGLLDQHGNDVTRGPGVAAGIDRRLDVAENVFEGIVKVWFYEDAIEGKGTCAHCNGPIEVVLRFPAGYSLAGSADRAERQADAKRQLYDKFKREHYCRPRLEGPKLPVEDFLRRFE